MHTTDCKLAAYGFDSYTICHVVSYLKNRNQCVTINNTFNDLPQRGSTRIHGWSSTFYFSDFLYFILIAHAHKYADYNTSTTFGKILEDLIATIKHQSELALS